MDESSSKNCSEYTKRELQGTAFIGNSCAVIYCFYLLVMSGTMVMFNKRKVYETVVKRLMAWLTAVTLLCQLLLAVNFTSNNFFYRNVILCQAYGFVIQYSWSVQLLFMLGVSLLLFSKVLEASPWKPAYVSALQERVKGGTYTCYGQSKENSFLIAAFIIPFLFDLIPFTTNSYGPFGPFCWIRNIETDCSTHLPGWVEQIVLLIAPFTILALFTLGLSTVSLCLFCCAIKNAKYQKMKMIQAVGIIDFISFVAYLGFILVLCAFNITALSVQHKKYKPYLWMIAATASGWYIPVSLLLPIQCALFSNVACACCKHKRPTHHQEESELGTIHKIYCVGPTSQLQ